VRIKTRYLVWLKKPYRREQLDATPPRVTLLAAAPQDAPNLVPDAEHGIQSRTG
jgi:hypothetical protein